MPEPTNLELAVRRDWNVEGIISDLREAPWEETEPGRLDRRIFLGNYDSLADLAKQATPKEEWDEAVGNGVEHEIVEEYLDALVSWVAELMDEHVYAEDYEGDVFLGQYKEGKEKPYIPGVLDWMPED